MHTAHTHPTAQNIATHRVNEHSEPKEPLELPFDPMANLGDNLLIGWQTFISNLRHSYISTADSLIDELLIQVTEEQVNNALHKFVVQNVGMLHELYMTLHDDWLRLYATVDIKGVFAKVACNFRLVGATLSKDTQRLVFEQLSDTEILTLHSKKWWYVPAAKTGVGVYKKVTGADPLPFLLQKIKVKDEPFAVHKGEYIYLDIHRYLAKQETILGYLAKAQVNDAHTKTGNLLLKVQINFGELLTLGEAGEDIITEKDSPDRKKKKRDA